ERADRGRAHPHQKTAAAAAARDRRHVEQGPRTRGPGHQSRRVTAMSELEDLRARLAESEETLRAIQHGEVDALLVTDEAGDRVFTLRSADAPYRALIEQMQEGAAALTIAGDVVYCNRRFAEMVDRPLEQVMGSPLEAVVDTADRPALKALVT